MKVIFVYAEQDTSPRFFDAINSIRQSLRLENKHGYRIMPVTAEGVNQLPFDQPVIVFGNVTDEAYQHKNNIFTYSPAQVLTKANSVTVVSSALKRAVGKERSGWGPQGKPHIQELETLPLDMIVALLSGLSKVPELAVDIETSGNLRAGTPDDDDIRLLTVSIYSPRDNYSYVFYGGYYEDLEGLEVENALAAFFELYQGKLIWHNGKFDARVLERILGVKVRVDEDTMLMHHVLNQAARMHGLKQLCMLYFGAEEWEADLKTYTKGGGHFENIPRDILAVYNGMDTYWTYVLYEHLKAQIDGDQNAQAAYALEIAASEFLLKVEQRGIPFDTGAANKLGENCDIEMRVALYELQILAGLDFNPNSPKQVKEQLAFWGIEVEKTDIATLTELKATLEHNTSEAEFIDWLLHYRKYKKVSSTYVKGWQSKERNGRVHPTFLIHGTTTGRLSSTSPNAQNVPRDATVRSIVGLTDSNWG